MAPASRTNAATSSARSTKPRPDVCTISNDDTTEPAETFDGASREIEEDAAMDSSWRPNVRTRPLDLAADVFLHPVGHLDQPPPGLFEERHHPIHVTIARQRDFDLARRLGYLWLRLFQRVRFRRCLIGHRRA